MGVQALGLGLGTLLSEMGVKPEIVTFGVPGLDPQGGSGDLYARLA